MLICWDHAHIPALPLVHGTVIPKMWPADRFDVIWTLTLVTSGAYSFAQIPQLLPSGDADTIIAAGRAPDARFLGERLQYLTEAYFREIRFTKVSYRG